MRGGRGVGTSSARSEEAEARRVAAPGQPGRELRAPGRCWWARADSSLDEEGCGHRAGAPRCVPRRRSAGLLRCVAARGGGGRGPAAPRTGGGCGVDGDDGEEMGTATRDEESGEMRRQP
jgi:hypothetical protein